MLPPNPPNTLNNLPTTPEQKRLAILREQILFIENPEEKWEKLSKYLLEEFPENAPAAPILQEETSKDIASTVNDPCLVKTPTPFTPEQEILIDYLKPHIDSLPAGLREFPEAASFKLIKRDKTPFTQGELMVMELGSALDLSCPPDFEPEEEFGRAPLTTEELKILVTSKYAPQLQVLDLSESDLGFEEMMVVAEAESLGNLQELNLSWNESHLVNALKEAKHLKNLRVLKLYYAEIGDEGAKTLASIPHFEKLETLDLNSNRLTDEGIEALTKAKHLGALKSLDVGFNPISSRGMHALAQTENFPNLRALSMELCRLGDEEIEILFQSENLTKLQSLNLEANDFEPFVLANALADTHSITRLEHLSLELILTTNEEAEAIMQSGKLQHLKSLSMGWIGRSKGVVEAIAKNCPEITTLKISASLEDAALEVLANSPSFAGLESLDLSRKKLNIEKARQVISASPFLKNLSSIKF